MAGLPHAEAAVALFSLNLSQHTEYRFMINEYVSLSTKVGFNKSLGHFRLVASIVEQVGRGVNLAQVMEGLERNREVEKSQIGPILNAVIIDRNEYKARSFNAPKDLSGFEKLAKEVEKWNRLDLIVAYHHPQLGITLIDPKSETHWENNPDISRDELVVVYARALNDADKKLEDASLEAMIALLVEGKAEGGGRFFDPQKRSGSPAAPVASAPAPSQAGRVAAPTPRQAPAGRTAAPTPRQAPSGRTAAPATRRDARPPSGPVRREAGVAASVSAAKKAPVAEASDAKKRVTPKYSVQVTNELFHNGNVEAWKNIIESYKAKYAGVEVHIFHDGQKVNNINSLFKWGKVKHGDVILFSIAGEEIAGVAKLQRYLFEGASNRFQTFLKKDVNKVLTLF